MIMPNILNLRRENWVKCSVEQRLEALNQLEGFIAGQEGRTPCPVSSEWLDSRTRGVHKYFDDGKENIELNTSLIASEEPYQAVETLIHEGRHSYQHHIVNYPELAENEQQLRDWMMSQEGGYIQPDGLNDSLYASQPTEIDARATARNKMDNLYESALQDEGYQGYKARKLQEESDFIEEARVDLGENYEQVAREEVQKRYHEHQSMQETQTAAPSTDLDNNTGNETSQIETNQMNPSLDKGSEPTPSQEKPLSYETYNQLRDNDLNYYEQLRDYAAEMEKKGLTSVVEEQKQEMRLTSERLDKLQKERDGFYDPTGKSREIPLTQESTSSQIDTKPDQALKSDKTESIGKSAEQARASEGIHTENPVQENDPNVALEGQALENSIGESAVQESHCESEVEEALASTLVDQGEASIGAVVPEVSEGVENISQAEEVAPPEERSTSDSIHDSNEESEDETYQYGLGF